MNIKEKMNLKFEGLVNEGPINIVAFGDSVTHGAVASGELNYETVYWNRLKKKLVEVSSYVPINMINAGIGGITAKGSLGRMKEHVFDHHPDLVIICFGLNDVNFPLEEYLASLTEMFEKCKEYGTDTVFMTPNMLNTYVAEDTAPIHLEYAAVTAEYQNSGKMDEYIYAATELAKSMNIRVCDCYSKWKKLSETEDTTLLLANRINHPTKEMHELFAQSLFEMIMDNEKSDEKNEEDTMIKM